MLSVSRADARNALWVTHGFTQLQQGMTGARKALQKHQCIQSDPIEVAGRNADLTLQSRVSDYNQQYLYDLLYTTREAFEYHCKMLSILPMEKYPFFNWMRTRLSERHAPFFEEHKKETAFILKMLEDGPVSSRDIKGWKKVDWWGRTALSRVILERLWSCGKVMIHHREGAIKYYALTEDVVPALCAEPPDDNTCVKEMTHIIVKAARLVSPSKAPEQWYSIGNAKKVRDILGILVKEGVVFPLTIEGIKGDLYVPAEDRKIWEDPLQPENDYVRFLAPLDPLIWNRSLFEAVYKMKYRWEVYKKAEDRVYGYYCLPILFNGETVGLIEPYFKKKEKVLEIRSFHMVQSVDKDRFMGAMTGELQRFAANVKAEKLTVDESTWLKDVL